MQSLRSHDLLCHFHATVIRMQDKQSSRTAFTTHAVVRWCKVQPKFLGTFCSFLHGYDCKGPLIYTLCFAIVFASPSSVRVGNRRTRSKFRSVLLNLHMASGLSNLHVASGRNKVWVWGCTGVYVMRDINTIAWADLVYRVPPFLHASKCCSLMLHV
jgi:hypothetical protein